MLHVTTMSILLVYAHFFFIPVGRSVFLIFQAFIINSYILAAASLLVDIAEGGLAGWLDISISSQATTFHFLLYPWRDDPVDAEVSLTQYSPFPTQSER